MFMEKHVNWNNKKLFIWWRMGDDRILLNWHYH